MNLTWNNFFLNLSRKTCIMGILNITPDSFSDGGVHFAGPSAVESGLRMVGDGADILDIGGESTRPGSEPVSLEEELRRTLPVIESLASQVKVPISIDTYKADVARRAIDAGASIVNDISGLRFDPEMPAVISHYGVPVVIMHMKGSPKNMQQAPSYAALIPEILEFMKTRIAFAVNAGIPEGRIVIDPGLGFGKTFDHNLEILHNLDKFTSLGRPILVGPSRKAFIGKVLDNAPATERLEGTAAAVAISIIKGANIVRVHDVKEMAKVAKVADAIKRGKIA